MASIQLVNRTTGLQTAVTIEMVFTPITGADTDISLARAVLVALNTDRRARPDDVLPNPGETDRRGWWGDLDASQIWGGWPIGTRLWLMSREKITEQGAKQGSTIEKARRFIAEALQPFVDARICSRFDIALRRVGTDRITGSIILYRGPLDSVALEYEDLWSVFGG